MLVDFEKDVFNRGLIVKEPVAKNKKEQKVVEGDEADDKAGA